MIISFVLLSSYSTMRPLSATECITPAIERTRDILSRPFRWQTFLKIAAVAFFAEIGNASLNVPSRGGGLRGIAPGLATAILTFALIIGFVTLVIGLILLYVGSRLQLVLVELVATRQTYVASVWRRFSTTTWPWIGLKVLYFLIVVLVCGLLASPFLIFFSLHHSSESFSFTSVHLSLILLAAAAGIFALLAVVAGYILLRDLALPSIALEDVPIFEALRRVRSLIAMEPGQVALFILLKLLLLVTFGIGGELLIVITVLISLVPFGLVGGGLWFALHNAGSAGTVILLACGVIAGLIFIGWVICLGIAVLGSIYVFSQAYALYFLGGRYPLLGDLLDRSTPPPAFTQAAFYPPPYYPPPPVLTPFERNPNL